jgi:hypothetical protein
MGVLNPSEVRRPVSDSEGMYTFELGSGPGIEREFVIEGPFHVVIISLSPHGLTFNDVDIRRRYAYL